MDPAASSSGTSFNPLGPPLDLTVFNVKDLVGQRLDIGQVMRDQDGRDIDVALQLGQFLPHPYPQACVQGRQGFIQQQ